MVVVEYCVIYIDSLFSRFFLLRIAAALYIVGVRSRVCMSDLFCMFLSLITGRWSLGVSYYRVVALPSLTPPSPDHPPLTPPIRPTTHFTNPSTSSTSKYGISCSSP